MGEKIAGLFFILHQQAGARQAGIFLAAVSDRHGFSEPQGKASAVQWELVEEVFEDVASRLGGLEGGAVKAEAAVALVCHGLLPSGLFDTVIAWGRGRLVQ